MQSKPIQISKEIKAYHKELGLEAENIIRIQIPQKIIELNKLLENNINPLDSSILNTDFSIVHTNNECILALVEVVRKLGFELSNYTNTIYMWLKLQIPKEEDGNNTGVEVIETLCSRISNIQTGIEEETWSHNYLANKLLLVSQIQKHPQLANSPIILQQAIEVDRKEQYNLYRRVRDFRDALVVLYDYILKNWDRIISPRGTVSIIDMY